ncbi:MAG: hypothetical protein ABEK36_01660 [Candidatus Aenigmatarchaeota archaeon]
MKRKIKLSLVFVAIALILFSPNSVGSANESSKTEETPTEKYISINGTVESLEGKMTTWMYGTHVLKKNGEIVYALNDDESDLDLYNSEKVMLKGTLIHSGIDTGPEYLEVTHIENLDRDSPKEVPEDGMDTKKMYVIGGVLGFILISTGLFAKFR